MSDYVTSKYRRNGSTSHSLLSTDVESMNEYRMKRNQAREIQLLRQEVAELRAIVEKFIQMTPMTHDV